jgi:hypothetical protein
MNLHEQINNYVALIMIRCHLRCIRLKSEPLFGIWTDSKFGHLADDNKGLIEYHYLAESAGPESHNGSNVRLVREGFPMRHPRLLAWAVALLVVSLCAPLTPVHADSGPKDRLWYSRCAGARRPPAALADRGVQLGADGPEAIIGGKLGRCACARPFPPKFYE